MTKEQKTKSIKDLKEKIGTTELALFASFKGMPTAELFETKKKLRQEKGHVQIVKNTLLKRAFGELNIKPEADSFWKGEIAAITTSGDDAAKLAKFTTEWAKKSEKVKSKGGFLKAKGQWLSVKTVGELAKLPSMLELRAQCVGTIAAPLSVLVNVLNAVIRDFVLTVAAIEQKQKKA